MWKSKSVSEWLNESVEEGVNVWESESFYFWKEQTNDYFLTFPVKPSKHPSFTKAGEKA